MRASVNRASVFSGATRQVAALYLALLLAWTGPSVAQSPDAVNLTLDQTRDVALQALNNGNPGLAVTLGRGLLKADPKDPLAYFVIASGYARLNNPVLARRAAGYAYRHSTLKEDRFHAAQLASRMAFDNGNYSLSQIWLRRTAIHAGSEDDEKRLAKDYRLLRRINPWSFRFRADLRPSDNVNNGSDTSLNIIDGVPDGGTISRSARALSGVIGSIDVRPGYRLRMSNTSATTLGARLYIERVSLSREAKSDAPRVTGSDFGSTYAELSLNHLFVAGPSDSGGTASIGLALGDYWYGGERSYQFARIEATRQWNFGDQAQLSLRADAEKRYRARYRSNDAELLGFGAGYNQTLANNDTLGLSAAFRNANAGSINGSYVSASIRTSYTPDQEIGPARVSLGLVLGFTRYDQFKASVFRPPTQRTDKSVYGDIALIFDRYDYAGFVPVLRLRTGRKDSNFSRFRSRELSLSLGIGSKF